MRGSFEHVLSFIPLTTSQQLPILGKIAMNYLCADIQGIPGKKTLPPFPPQWFFSGIPCSYHEFMKFGNFEVYIFFGFVNFSSII